MRISPEAIVADKRLEPIPQEIEIKEAFVDRYRELLGTQYGTFLEHSLSYARKSIRVNTLKISVDELQRRLGDWRLEPIPWCPEGFFLTYRNEERYDIGNLVEHQLGYLYVQDSASMIPPVVLRPLPGEFVLDLCAAPGSKTTQMAAMMENEGLLFANDVAGSRMKPLGLNLQRCGVRNTIVTLRANRKFAQIFDKVLVDAPCSATGTVRKSLKALQMWSPGFVRKMAAEQRKLLAEGWRCLKPGGLLVYSTCTLEPDENEANVSQFLDRHDDAALEEIDLPIARSPAVRAFAGRTFRPEVEKCLRIWPQDNDTEGFFVATFRKLA